MIVLNQVCKIANCGQLEAGSDFGLTEVDGTEDVFPPFPDDADIDFTQVFHD